LSLLFNLIKEIGSTGSNIIFLDLVWGLGYRKLNKMFSETAKNI